MVIRILFPYDIQCGNDFNAGIDVPRRAKDGGDLPSARTVSLEVFKDQDRPSHVHTSLYVTFGQFLDHDMTRTAVTKLSVEPLGNGFSPHLFVPIGWNKLLACSVCTFAALDMPHWGQLSHLSRGCCVHWCFHVQKCHEAVEFFSLFFCSQKKANCCTLHSGSGKMADVTCGHSECETRGAENRACFPISVSPHDPDFRGKECLMFVRTQESLKDDCSLGRYQAESITLIIYECVGSV